MTPEQRDHILAVIDKDANGHGWLALMRNGEPEVCIMGGLAIEAGFTFEQLENKSQPGHVRTKVEGETLFRRLKTLFGLTPTQRNTLVGVNDRDDWPETDSAKVHEARRVRLREVVNGWETS